MANNILFILEGKTEKQVTNSIEKNIINNKTIVTCVYCTTIYKMYQDISKDEDLDTFSLIKNLNKEKLKNFRRTDFAEIFMFFDYDGHASNACDKKMNELISFFDEETDKGKLYISYPMIESLKHIKDLDLFYETTIKIEYFEKYKGLVSKECSSVPKHFHLYNLSIWKLIIEKHLSKTNYLINNTNEFPSTFLSQKNVFEKQIEKHIKPNKEVSIISCFPLFLLDYYGIKKLTEKLSK